jgi:hypothetical protein
MIELTPRQVLEEVKRRITKDNYNQENFCGTVCCIAGHIDCVVNGEEEHAKHSSGDVLHAADIVIKNDFSNSTWLFSWAYYWPEKAKQEYCRDPVYGARIAIDMYMEERDL